MQTIKSVLDQIMAEALKRAISGDREGAVQAATAGKNICTLAQGLDLPLSAPFELLQAARELLELAADAKQTAQGTAA